MKRATWNLAIAVALVGGALAAAPTTEPANSAAVFSQDLEKTAGAKLPDDLQVMAGEFIVAGEAGHHYLELPGEPLDTFGLLFGPPVDAFPDVSARVWGAPTGKRFPEFGIGCCDVSGYKLWMLPGQGRVELRKGDDALTSGSFAWKAGEWTHLRLRVSPGDGKTWRVEGKVWSDGTPEPQKWTLRFDETEQPPAGRASIWGEPFSGKPIRFDQLTVAHRT